MTSNVMHHMSENENTTLIDRLEALQRENQDLRQRLERAPVAQQVSTPDHFIDPSTIECDVTKSSSQNTEVCSASHVQVAEMGDDGRMIAFDLDHCTGTAGADAIEGCSPFLHRPSTAVPPFIRIGGKASPLSVLTNRPPVYVDLKALMPAFWHSVRAADASNISNRLISVSTAFDQSHTGCSISGSGVKGSSQAMEGSLQQIFFFYAARQSISDSGGGAVSFEDIMRSNTTMSRAELNKFLEDMVAYSVPREFVRTVFLVANCTEGISDEITSELSFEEFLLSLVKISVFIFHDDDVLFPDLNSRRTCVLKMAEHLNLDDPVGTEKFLKRIAKSSAGFGAWKLPPDASTDIKKDRKVRVRKTIPLSRLLPTDKQELAILVGDFLSRSQAKSKISWQDFPSCYIGMHTPSILPSKRVILSVTVRNKSGNSMSFLPKMKNLPPLCFKFLPPHKCPPGMDWSLRMWIDIPAPASISSGSIEIYDVSDSDEENLVVSIPVLVSIVDVSRGHQDFSATFEPLKTIRLPGAVPKDFQNLKRNLCVPIMPQHFDLEDQDSPHSSPVPKTSGSGHFALSSKGKHSPLSLVRSDSPGKNMLSSSPSKSRS